MSIMKEYLNKLKKKKTEETGIKNLIGRKRKKSNAIEEVYFQSSPTPTSNSKEIEPITKKIKKKKQIEKDSNLTKVDCTKGTKWNEIESFQ